MLQINRSINNVSDSLSKSESKQYYVDNLSDLYMEIMNNDSDDNQTWSEFVEYIKCQQFQSIQITDNEIEIHDDEYESQYIWEWKIVA